MKSKQQIKSMVYQNRIGGFLLQNTYSSYHSSPNCVSKNSYPFSHIFLLWAIPSHIIMIQNQQEFKIQTNNVP
jgi:hypothetical protein